MRKYIKGFIQRGLTACGLGPLFLAILYLILHQSSVIDTLTVREVSTGIFSLTVLAFIAGGINVIYQIDQLPLMIAILIHGSILYVIYLLTYLINNWLQWNVIPIILFTCIFSVGYLAIWAIIYIIIKRKTYILNQKLKKKKEEAF